MDGDELRERQRPIKARYRTEPDAALVTLHEATGGDGHACSGDMLLQALVACAGVTLRSVATSRGIDVTGTVRAEGDLDVRGTLGLAASGQALRHVLLGGDPLPGHEATKIIGEVLAELD